MARYYHYDSKVHAAIARRFCAPRWATFFEVRDAASFDATGSADAISVATWKSDKLAVHGFEIKRSRGDLLKELKSPGKAEKFMRYCDYWWITVEDAKIVDNLVLPETWGIMALHGKQLRELRKAPKLEPEKFDRGFVASLLRRATEHVVPKALVEEKINEAVEQERKRLEGLNEDKSQHTRALRDAEQIREQVSKFTRGLGCDLYDFVHDRNPEQFGRVVRAVRDLRLNLNLDFLRNQLKATLEDIDKLQRAEEHVKAKIAEQLPEVGT